MLLMLSILPFMRMFCPTTASLIYRSFSAGPVIKDIDTQLAGGVLTAEYDLNEIKPELPCNRFL